MRVRFVGYLFDPTGYGEFGRSLVELLHESGHEVSAVPVSRRVPGRSFGRKGELVAELGRRAMSRPDVTVVNTLPSLFGRYAIGGSLNVGFTMCEGGKIPESWPYLCSAMDGILVPSEENRRVFSAGVSVPVRTLHLGVSNADSCVVGGRPLNSRATFTFLSVFEWTERKNPAALIRAYSRAFSRDDDVVLRLKLFVRKKQGGFEAACRMVREARKDLPPRNHPSIEIVEGALSDGAMGELYACSDAVVSAHRAEGWALPLWRAMLEGLPVIATGYGGNMEYMDSVNSYPVSFSLSPVTMRHPHFDGSMRWADVDEEELSQKMRRVFEHREKAHAVGTCARRSLIEKFPLRKFALDFDEAIAWFSRERSKNLSSSAAE